MSLQAPYTPAMRIGQGFNSYTHEICVNDAVIVDKANPAGDHFAKDSGQVSQIVTYATRFVDKVSQVTDAMNVSAALSIKSASFGLGASGSYVDSGKFKESNINFFVQVKVVNQVIMAEDATLFQDIPTIKGGRDFTKVFGDCFISGFIEGGELDAIVSIKTKDTASENSIKVALEANFGKGVGVDLKGKFAKDHIDTLAQSETTITVNWNGGGNIKPKDHLWSIETLTEAAAAFPENVANTPQRTFAILTPYEKLRSYQMQRTVSPLNYDLADLYTNDLLDLYMDYKHLWKSIHLLFVAYEFGKITLKKSEWKEEGHAARKQEDRRKPELQEIIKHFEDNPSDSHDQEISWLKSFLAARNNRDHDAQYYEPTFAGLMKAKKDCRAEMIKIVKEVDAINNDPSLAQDVDRDCGAFNPAIFRHLLPIDEPAKPIAKNTSLSYSVPSAPAPTFTKLTSNGERDEQVNGDSAALALVGDAPDEN